MPVRVDASSKIKVILRTFQDNHQLFQFGLQLSKDEQHNTSCALLKLLCVHFVTETTQEIADFLDCPWATLFDLCSHLHLPRRLWTSSSCGLWFKRQEAMRR